MKFKHLFLILPLLGLMSLSTSCQRTSGDVWEDSKSASRHMTRGVRTLGGKQGSSRAVCRRDDFMPMEDGCYRDQDDSMSEFTVPPLDFIPLSDQPQEDEIAMAEYVRSQPREAPGDPWGSIPGVDAFQDPSMYSEWSGVFQNIYFDYNSNLVKGPSIQTARSVAHYMKQNPNTYIFVEGHCDERGAEAYNLSLGARRSNAVRNFLIQEGVNPDHVFTISYGKERPIIHDHHEEAWRQNRRAEFKVYQR